MVGLYTALFSPQRVGENPAATRLAIQNPKEELQSNNRAAGTPTPAVTAPEVNPAAAYIARNRQGVATNLSHAVGQRACLCKCGGLANVMRKMQIIARRIRWKNMFGGGMIMNDDGW
jgi:hypothetical protein